MLELNYIVVPNNIEIGGGGLSQIFWGRLWTNNNPNFVATVVYLDYTFNKI
jgi:hypothetical protein